VLNDIEKRVVQKQPPETLGRGSVLPADMFGGNLKGVYQIRTRENVDFVVQLAAETAGVDPPPPSSEMAGSLVTSSSRPWYDRPRNELKSLQKLTILAILAGVRDYDLANGGIGIEQWGIAGVLFLASFLILGNKAYP
jgi:hypothetical protein